MLVFASIPQPAQTIRGEMSGSLCDVDSLVKSELKAICGTCRHVLSTTRKKSKQKFQLVTARFVEGVDFVYGTWIGGLRNRTGQYCAYSFDVRPFDEVRDSFI